MVRKIKRPWNKSCNSYGLIPKFGTLSANRYTGMIIGMGGLAWNKYWPADSRAQVRNLHKWQRPPFCPKPKNHIFALEDFSDTAKCSQWQHDLWSKICSKLLLEDTDVKPIFKGCEQKNFDLIISFFHTISINGGQGPLNEYRSRDFRAWVRKFLKSPGNWKTSNSLYTATIQPRYGQYTAVSLAD